MKVGFCLARIDATTLQLSATSTPVKHDVLQLARRKLLEIAFSPKSDLMKIGVNSNGKKVQFKTFSQVVSHFSTVIITAHSFNSGFNVFGGTEDIPVPFAPVEEENGEPDTARVDFNITLTKDEMDWHTAAPASTWMLRSLAGTNMSKRLGCGKHIELRNNRCRVMVRVDSVKTFTGDNSLRDTIAFFDSFETLSNVLKKSAPAADVTTDDVRDHLENYCVVAGCGIVAFNIVKVCRKPIYLVSSNIHKMFVYPRGFFHGHHSVYPRGVRLRFGSVSEGSNVNYKPNHRCLLSRGSPRYDSQFENYLFHYVV